MKHISKKDAIERILDILKWGDSIPCVFGGQGGTGFEYYHIFSDSDVAFKTQKKELESQEFTDTPEISEEFKKAPKLDMKDYDYCVQFTDVDSWVQLLLWEN